MHNGSFYTCRYKYYKKFLKKTKKNYLYLPTDLILKKNVIIQNSSNLLSAFILANADDIIDLHSGYHDVITEFSNDLDADVTLLPLDELVTFLNDCGLDLTTVDGLLIKFFPKFEGDDGVLEGGSGVQGVHPVFFSQSHTWSGAVAHFSGHKAHPELFHEFVEIL